MTHLSFYAHGKILLTSEYFIMDGVRGLALPTCLGQKMDVECGDVCQGHHPQLFWKAHDPDDRLWMESVFDLKTMRVHHGQSPKEDETFLAKILQQARLLNPDFLNHPYDVHVTTRLEFSKDWGLGSSSTLIAMMAQWADICPFTLLKKTFGGSGYDVVCANAQGPIIYSVSNGNPSWDDAAFHPPFKDHLYFVHLNKKQNSREGIDHYRHINPSCGDYYAHLNQVTDQMVQVKQLADFEKLLLDHENLMARALGLLKVQDTLFPDYDAGVIKSLGAWGGDFALVTSHRDKQECFAYFHDRGYKTILTYDELIL